MHNSAQLRCFENGNDDFGVEAFWIGDAARVGYFVPLNGPLNGHPPSIYYDSKGCGGYNWPVRFLFYCRSLCMKFPRKHSIMMSFLSSMLRDEVRPIAT